MPNHTITQTGQVVQCEACGWRCILTSRGPFVRDAGDATVDHLAAVAARKAQADQAIRDLILRYRTDRRCSMALLKRLFDHIRAEHEL